jgi:hypothetical protein
VVLVRKGSLKFQLFKRLPLAKDMKKRIWKKFESDRDNLLW